MEQFNSGELDFIFEINFHKTNIGRMIVGNYAWQQQEDQKRRYQYCSDDSGNVVYLRALQRHSRRSLIDPSLQDNMIIQRGLFHHVYHMGCAFNLHSIINSGSIPGGQDSSRRQTVFFLPIDPRDKGHQDLAHIAFSAPRRAQYLHSAWKNHQDAVFWVDIDLAIRKGLTFYQTRSNAIILQGTLPVYCTPKVVRLKTGEVLYEKSYMSPRPPPKISLRHDHDWTRRNDELSSTVDQQPVGKLVQQSCGETRHATFSQLTLEDVFFVKCETYRSHEIDAKGFHGELGSSDRSRQPDITLSVIDARNLSEKTRIEQTHDGSGQPDGRYSSSAHTVKEQFAPEENRDFALFNTDNEFNRAINEENIDFNIPGLPHSAMKQSHGANVQDLIQKIENHPQRHALQSDLQQRQQFNPFSKESRDVIKAAGNTELCELLDVESKAQCKMSVVLGRRHRLLHVRALLSRWNGGEQEIRPVHHGSPLDSQLLHQERATPRAPLREEAGRSRLLHREVAQEETQEATFLGSSRPVHP